MIGVFDSGLGGLSILRDIRRRLPEYDYIYLGDNARAPYGSRSFEVVSEYTWQAVSYLFERGCNLVILACNTASAKALRQIQQTKLPSVWGAEEGHKESDIGLHRVLGVIRPTVEVISNYSKTKHVGIVATQGTVNSMSYPIELQKHAPELVVNQQSCPLWVPLIEQNEHHTPAMSYFIDKYLTELFTADSKIDTLLLACTHYPLIKDQIEQWLTDKCKSVKVVAQGEIVAQSLKDYLDRHLAIESTCRRGGKCLYLTTETADRFSAQAKLFLGEQVNASHVELS